MCYFLSDILESQPIMIIRRYSNISELPAKLPLFPLSGALLLPRVDMPLNIFESRYISMIDDAMAGIRLIGIIQPV